MKSKLLILLSIITLGSLASCGDQVSSIISGITTSSTVNVTTSSNNVASTTTNVVSTIDVTTTAQITTTITSTGTSTSINKTYTIIWQNYDGEVLEVDENVLEGTMPSYDGVTPTRKEENGVRYSFNGWSPSITNVYEDRTYIAVYKVEYDDEKSFSPVLSSDGKSVEYGLYPQTHVRDQSLIESLNTLSPGTNGWYLYNGDYYVKEVANVYMGDSYTFNDGSAIINSSSYWFKCENIKWDVLKQDNGVYTLLSSTLLDVQKFYRNYEDRTIDGKIVSSNNYEHSDIRNWLNTSFLNNAFSLNDIHLQKMNVDGLSLDKVSLLTYDDYLNAEYGFEINAEALSSTRECKTTDYSRVKGAWCDQNKNYNGVYWTRSSSIEYYYCAWTINSGGYLSEHAVDGGDHSVRPYITITI